ncbi:putative U box domain, armadillo-like helical, Zinc finger, RING/FYVE/PHD-type [Helianthus annuus]|nr:putative U box domain, armadillo-like helical, Zinc finger, RING/FYVE/PHD-type [Helianthus annuus]
MAREKSNGLYLSVPSFFKCPISMDVMKSPVSLCTGVTYDRQSIQKWLDSGHNTCPATMQVLQSTDVVPNLTLRRLIRVWSDSYLLRPESHASFNNHIAFESLKKLISSECSEQSERVSVASDAGYPAVDAGLAALIAVCTSRQSKKEIVRLGIVKSAGKLLSSPENSVTVVEKAMKVLEIISTCTEGRTAICEDENCVPAVVKRLMKVSPAATEYGIGVIWSVCYMSRDRTAQEAAMRNNGLTKVLLVMQSNCSGSVRQMCGELVKVFRVNSKSCLASYETRTTHITPY